MKNTKKIDTKNFNMPELKKARKRLNSAEIKRNEYILTNEMKKFGKGKTFHIRTYGCQSNERDTETMEGIFKDMGYTYTDE